MTGGKLWRFTRGFVAGLMSILLVATPVAASVTPVLTGPVAHVSDDPSDTFSKEAHAQALLQLGLQEQGCQSGEARAEQDTQGAIWFLGGCILGFIGLAGAYLIEPSPPASALVGQDAEFVAEYTDCYVDRAKQIQTTSALYGCLTGAAVTGLYYVVVIAALASTTTTSSTF